VADPGYADTPLGWDLSTENAGREWIELRFGASVYVSGFELYESFKPGAVYRLSTAQAYADDNTIACCGADAAAARPQHCADKPICAETTAWNPIWTGTAGNSGESATIFRPPVCPYAYRTDVLRVDLDTAAASGWNNYDAAKIIGTIDFPPGLILPDNTAPAGHENRVAYVPLRGVHGVDSFEYAVTDCLAYGPPAAVHVTLPTPAAPFDAQPYASISAVLPTSTTTVVSVAFDLSTLQQTGTFSLYTLLDGNAPVRVELRAVRYIRARPLALSPHPSSGIRHHPHPCPRPHFHPHSHSYPHRCLTQPSARLCASQETTPLPHTLLRTDATWQVRGSLTSLTLPTSTTPSTLSMATPNTTLLPPDWTSRQTWHASGGRGEAEVWLSNGGPLTFRVLVTVLPPFIEQCTAGQILNYNHDGTITCVPVRVPASPDVCRRYQPGTEKVPPWA
jgi:hypothetical protein